MPATAYIQQHSLQCPEVKAKIKVNGSYKDIFEEDIPSEISNTLLRINQFREDFLWSHVWGPGAFS